MRLIHSIGHPGSRTRLTAQSRAAPIAAALMETGVEEERRTGRADCGLAAAKAASHGMKRIAVMRMDHCASWTDVRYATDANIGRRCQLRAVIPYARANDARAMKRTDA